MDWVWARWIYVLAAAVLMLGAAGLTGSSAGYAAFASPYYTPAERAYRPEVVGRSRAIRWDEWAIDTPVARAQQLASPAFPLVNPGVGLGMLARNTGTVPVLDWGLVFRPLLWPTLLGNRYALGLRWYARLAVALLALFWAFGALSGAPADASAEARRRHATIAGLAAVAVVFSSAFQWWFATGYIEALAFGALVIVAAERALHGTGLRRAAWLALLAWSASCMFFAFYPPIWAPMLWVVCSAILDLQLRRGASPSRTILRAAPVIALVASGALASIAYFAPYLLQMVGTVYPGQRVATAGGWPLVRVLDAIWPSLEVLPRLNGDALLLGPATAPAEVFSNVCEASAIEVLPLVLVACLCAVSAPCRSAVWSAIRASPFSAMAWAVLTAWLFLPLPDVAGSLLLLKWSPVHRTTWPWGISCALWALLLIHAVAARAPVPPASRRAVATGLLLATFAAGLVYVQPGVEGADAVQYFAPLVLALVLGTAALWRPDRPLLFALSWALPAVLANAPVNPVSRSEDMYRAGAGHAALLDALRHTPGRVVEYFGSTGSVLAGHGVPALAATQFTPDIGLFRFLAPASGNYPEAVYNRYMSYGFVLPPAPTALLSMDAASIAISPCSRRLNALGVNHFVAPPRAQLPSACARDFAVRRAAHVQIWTRVRPVCAVGVHEGPGAPDGALDFDWSCPAAATRAALRWRGDRLTMAFPADARRTYATALNTRLVDRIDCENASSTVRDAHVLIKPTGGGSARCTVHFIGSAAALRRLLGPEADRYTVVHRAPGAAR